jgi:hypothetical protein
VDVLRQSRPREREPQAFLSTDLTVSPEEILRWFVSRWGIETKFQEAGTHLGVETQRQWSDLAIQRTMHVPASYGHHPNPRQPSAKTHRNPPPRDRSWVFPDSAATVAALSQ